MGRIRGSVVVQCVVGIAVVSNDYRVVAMAFRRFHYVAHAIVDCSHGFLYRAVDPGMAYHVAVGEVDHDEVERLLVYFRHEFFRNLVRAHFWLEVVGCHLGRRDEYALFAGPLGLTAAVEEERYVGVFLCFGYVELPQSVLERYSASVSATSSCRRGCGRP